MRSYNRNSRSGGGRYGGGDFRRSSGRREMHKAVCDECGKSCEVPFRPSGDKPIYCSDCFERREGGSSRGSDRRDSGRSREGERDNANTKILEQLTSLNSKLDRILKVIESRDDPKPVSKKTEVKKAEVKKVVKKVAEEVEVKEKKKTRKKKASKSTPKE